MQIHAFQSTSQTKNQNQKPFEYQNKVQCKACGVFGHNIGDKICQVSAMVYNVHNYEKKHQSQMESNAIKFNAFHSKKGIKNVYKHPDFSPTYTQQDHEHLIEKITNKTMEVVPELSINILQIW